MYYALYLNKRLASNDLNKKYIYLESQNWYTYTVVYKNFHSVKYISAFLLFAWL